MCYPNLHDKSAAVVEVFQIQHISISGVDGNTPPRIYTDSPDPVDGISRAKGRVRSKAAGIFRKHHSRILHHGLKAALRKQDQTRAGSILIRQLKKALAIDTRVASKFIADVEGRRNDIAPLLAQRHRDQVAQRACLRAIVEQVGEVISRGNNNIVADREADGISVALGKKRIFQPERNLTVSAAIVAHKREILDVTSGRRKWRRRRNAVAQSISDQGVIYGARVLGSGIVRGRQTELRAASDVRVLIGIEARVHIEPICNAIASASTPSWKMVTLPGIRPNLFPNTENAKPPLGRVSAVSTVNSPMVPVVASMGVNLGAASAGRPPGLLATCRLLRWKRSCR